MRPRRLRALAGLVTVFAGLTALPARTSTEEPPADGPSPRQLMAEAALLSPREAQMVEQGDVVVRLLDGTAGHEVAVSGAVRVAAPRDAFLDLAADLPRFKRGSAILQLGVFGRIPSAGDLASLTLDETELAALRRCASGDCTSKLAALDIDAFRRFDWDAPDAKARAEGLVRAGLAAYVRDYVIRGNAAMMNFARTRVPTSLATEFRAVLTASSNVMQAVPDLAAFLSQYNACPLPGNSSEVVYWARETFGMKPMLSAYHVVIQRSAQPGLGVAVSKQFYASRYLDVSLEVILAADDPAPLAGAGCYLVYTARSRVDSLRGFLGGLKRGPVGRESVEATTARLRNLQSRLDQAAGTSRPAAPGRE